jgi:hypothetical protein
MESHAPAEELPALYRAILARVAELEASGRRTEAGRIRRQATAAYSRAWDDRARRRLTDLLRTATRPLPTERRGRGTGPLTRGLARRQQQTVVPER